MFKVPCSRFNERVAKGTEQRAEAGSLSLRL
jgi:hypothetical protein